MGTGWQGTRHMPTDWARRKTTVMHNAGNQCQAIEGGTRCPLPATEVDHIVPLGEEGTHDMTNLAALCHDHHAIKSKAEAARGRARQPRERRPPEAHPGLM